MHLRYKSAQQCRGTSCWGKQEALSQLQRDSTKSTEIGNGFEAEWPMYI
jgi:hypothetical protein